MTEPTKGSVDAELLAQLRASGPLRFDDFMALVLYSEPWGFYRNHTPGDDWTYRTSPTLTPWFAKLLSKTFVDMWDGLDRPKDFTVIEVGGGNGAFASQAMTFLPDELVATMRWVFVEPFDQIAARQKQAVSGIPGRFDRVRKMNEIEPTTGCIFANEVVDNFPARVIEVGEDLLQEVYVSADASRAKELLLPVEDTWALAQAKEPAQHLSTGDRFELKPMLGGWAKDISLALSSGYLLVIDYGDVQPLIWTRRPFGSIVSYRGESMGVDPLEGLGSTDITSHVDFTALVRECEAVGFESHHLVSQREFLKKLGLDDAIDELRATEQSAKDQGDYALYLATMAERSRVHALGMQQGLGDLLVLLSTIKAPSLA